MKKHLPVYVTALLFVFAPILRGQQKEALRLVDAGLTALRDVRKQQLSGSCCRRPLIWYLFTLMLGVRLSGIRSSVFEHAIDLRAH